MARQPARDVVAGDRIEITKTGPGAHEWNLRRGATGTVTEVRATALIVDWDDPALNGASQAPTILMTGLDKWRVLANGADRSGPTVTAPPWVAEPRPTPPLTAARAWRNEHATELADALRQPRWRELARWLSPFRQVAGHPGEDQP